LLRDPHRRALCSGYSFTRCDVLAAATGGRIN
jgi:hypothetical protein